MSMRLRQKRGPCHLLFLHGPLRPAHPPSHTHIGSSGLRGLSSFWDGPTPAGLRREGCPPVTGLILSRASGEKRQWLEQFFGGRVGSGGLEETGHRPPRATKLDGKRGPDGLDYVSPSRKGLPSVTRQGCESRGFRRPDSSARPWAGETHPIA